MAWFRKAICRHSWSPKKVTETGKLCFSFNCARPEIEVSETCDKCGAVKTERFMSGIPSKALPLTPEIAGRVLRDEFGH
jgi:hypothetical protein